MPKESAVRQFYCYSVIVLVLGVVTGSYILQSLCLSFSKVVVHCVPDRSQIQIQI